MMRYALTLLLGTILCASLSAQEPTYRAVDNSVLRAYTDTTDYWTGGILKYTVEYRAAAEKVELDSLNGFALVGTAVDTLDQGSVRQTFELLVLDTGQLDLPKAYLHYTGDVYTTQALNITSRIMPADPDQPRAAQRKLRSIAFDFWHWTDHFKYYLLGALAFVLLIVALWRWAKNRKRTAETVEIVPEKDWFADTMEALAKMRKEEPWSTDAKGYYISLGDILRSYLSHQTQMPLSEKTTSEALDLLRTRWSESDLDRYEFIMTRADYVKFAKGQMTAQDHLDCLRRAEQLVLDFKPKTVQEDGDR